MTDAGEDQSIFVGDYTLLEGSATDPDNDDILTWIWSVDSLKVKKIVEECFGVWPERNSLSVSSSN